MQLSVAIILVLIANILVRVQSKLTINSRNVCSEARTYNEKRLRTTMKPKSEIQEHWCFSITSFFRCTKKRTTWENVEEVQWVPVTRTLLVCCEGYKEVGGECEPICRCIHGKCVKPNFCLCYPGFYGLQCSKECPTGSWGEYCRQECNCSNGGLCSVTEGCVCQPGWTGERCQIPSPLVSLCKSGDEDCSQITGENVLTTTAISTTTETLFQFTITDTSSTIDTMQPLLISTTHSVSEASAEAHQSSEESTTLNEISVTEITEKSVLIDESNTIVIENNTWKEPEAITEKTDESSSRMVKVEEMNPSEAEDFENERTGEVFPTESDVKVTKAETLATEISRTKIEREEEKLKDVKINFVENEIEIRGDPEGTNAETEVISNAVSPEIPNELLVTRNETNLSNFTLKKKDADKNEKENFIFEGRRNSHKETVFTFLHFLPSLSVLSAVSFLIIIIAARWAFINHRKKTRTLVVVAEKGNIFRAEEHVHLFWVNNCTVNPVYMSDVDLNNTTPVLQTFKPVEKPLTLKERTAL